MRKALGLLVVLCGFKMTSESKVEIADLAQAVNPDIKIFEMLCDGNGKLSPRPR
jgi:hypothetical protein